MWKIRHWQDAVNAALGVWLMVSPWALGYAADMPAVSNAFLVGALLLAAALGAIFLPRAWEEWSEAALGLWAIVSPWVLGFSSDSLATSCAVVSGVAILALALWTLMTDSEYNSWMHRHPAH